MTTTILEKNIETGQVQVSIHIESELNLSALVARRKVTGYLIDHVSDHLSGDMPALVVNDQGRLLWRVPVVLYLTSRGRVGKVGEIDVDPQTGQLLVTQLLLKELRTRADEVAARSAS
jgi:hypothetical protein